MPGRRCKPPEADTVKPIQRGDVDSVPENKLARPSASQQALVGDLPGISPTTRTWRRLLINFGSHRLKHIIRTADRIFITCASSGPPTPGRTSPATSPRERASASPSNPTSITSRPACASSPLPVLRPPPTRSSSPPPSRRIPPWHCATCCCTPRRVARHKAVRLTVKGVLVPCGGAAGGGRPSCGLVRLSLGHQCCCEQQRRAACRGDAGIFQARRFCR